MMLQCNHRRVCCTGSRHSALVFHQVVQLPCQLAGSRFAGSVTNLEYKRARFQDCHKVFHCTAKVDPVLAAQSVLEERIAKDLYYRNLQQGFVWAAEKSSVDEVEAMLNKGALVDAQDIHGRIALHYAARAGSVSVVELLLDKGAPVDAMDLHAETALHVAAEKDHVAVAKLLLDKGADVEMTDVNLHTPLHVAAINNSLAVAELLLDKGASIEELDDWGDTALDKAALQGSLAVAQLLLDKGARIATDCENGGRTQSALHYAAERDNVAMAKLLLDRGANVDARDEDGRTALHRTTDSNDKVAVAQLLLDHGASVDANVRGYTTLHWAASGGCLTSAKLLLDKGASPHAESMDGTTPLDLAVKYGSVAIVRLLKGKGA